MNAGQRRAGAGPVAPAGRSAAHRSNMTTWSIRIGSIGAVKSIATPFTWQLQSIFQTCCSQLKSSCVCVCIVRLCMHVFVRLPPLLLKSKECETFTRSLSPKAERIWLNDARMSSMCLSCYRAAVDRTKKRFRWDSLSQACTHKQYGCIGFIIEWSSSSVAPGGSVQNLKGRLTSKSATYFISPVVSRQVLQMSPAEMSVEMSAFSPI